METRKYRLVISVGEDAEEVRYAILSPKQADLIKMDIAGELNRKFEITDVTGERIESGIIDRIEKVNQYKVYVSELRYGTVYVDADSEDEAKKIAEDRWNNKSIAWHEREITDIQAKEAV